MRGKAQVPPAARHEFVLHVPTDQAGSVICVSPAGVEADITVRLAGGELVCAPAREFRPATAAEIESRHRAAAFVRLLVLPALPLLPSPACFHLHKG